MNPTQERAQRTTTAVTFGELLTAVRRMNELSIEQLAHRCKAVRDDGQVVVTRDRIRSLEADDQVPSRAEVETLAVAMYVPSDQLVAFAEVALSGSDSDIPWLDESAA